MDRFTALLEGLISEGRPLEEALTKLRAEGATPVETIKAIHFALGVSIAEAKQAFSNSPAWTQEAAAGAALHDEMFAALDKGSLE
jgi:ribosomal protein L7/L12